MIQLVESVYRIHQLLKIHGQIDPSNIFIDDNDNLLLGSVFNDDSISLSCYQAAEVYMNYTKTKQSDVWSIGIVWSLLLTGEVPFDE